jgi:hypothetical protein
MEFDGNGTLVIGFGILKYYVGLTVTVVTFYYDDTKALILFIGYDLIYGFFFYNFLYVSLGSRNKYVSLGSRNRYIAGCVLCCLGFRSL